MKKIVVLDGYTTNPGDMSWDQLNELGEVVVYPRTSVEQLDDRLKDANIVLTNKVAITDEVLKRHPQIEYIGVLATGYNVIDLKAASQHNVVVTNIPAYSTESVAQLTFAHIFNVTNRIAHYAKQTRNGMWASCQDFCYTDTPLHEVYGKTIGLVGLGNIGYRVASIAHTFGMDVFAVTSKNAADLPSFIKKTTIEGLLATSDIVSLHCPLNEQTAQLINAETLAKVRPGTILINTARGGLIDEKAVAEALTDGRLGAYCADVLTQEPPTKDNPLYIAPNAYITPHIAWATVEARTRLMKTAVDNVRAFLEGNPQNVVNK